MQNAQVICQETFRHPHIQVKHTNVFNIMPEGGGYMGLNGRCFNPCQCTPFLNYHIKSPEFIQFGMARLSTSASCNYFEGTDLTSN